MRHEPDIVKVIGHGRLIDSESYERTCLAWDSISLQLGSYYVVTWPDHVPCAIFDASARYHGPFGTYDVARSELWKRVVRPLGDYPDYGRLPAYRDLERRRKVRDAYRPPEDDSESRSAKEKSHYA